MGIQEQKSKLEAITITENGIYNKEDGYNEVEVALYIPKTRIYNGFRFVSEGNNDYKLIRDIDFSQYDWSGVYELDDFFAGFKSTDGGGLISSDFDNFMENFDGEILSCYNMFYGTNALKESPNFGNKTKNCLNMKYMFNGCSSLTSIPYFDTSKVTDMNYMFSGCSSLTSIPQLDTSNVTNMYYMFQECRALANLPHLDTSNVTNMNGMFSNCTSLTTIPQLDTSKVTDMGFMFENIIYNNQSKWSYIPLLDCGNVTKISGLFAASYADFLNLTDFGGFKDLGKQNVLEGTNSSFLKRVPNATHESLLNILNNLYDRKTAGYSTLTLNIGSTNLTKLTDEEKTIAINKGWNLS